MGIGYIDGTMMDAEELKNIRKKLHTNPEISGSEQWTRNIILDFLSTCQPTQLIEPVAGTGILCVFDSLKPGPCIIFRAELDALPITEQNTFEHVSTNSGISHACGHDGHMSILLGLARFLSENIKQLTGKIVLLFQPAEENATGAKHIMQDSRFHDLKPMYVFGFHNIPAYLLGSIIINQTVFASASQGVIIRFHGKTSHAGHPEEGINPLPYLLQSIQILNTISKEYSEKTPGSFITIIHMNLGEQAFGTSPGEAVLMATLRSPDQQVMDDMANIILDRLSVALNEFQGTWDYEWVEVFPAIHNHKKSVSMIKKAAQSLDFEIINRESPFPWTEDFSYYLQKYNGAFFGLGAGLHHPQLHHPTYDFPDELISYGVALCEKIIIQCIQSHSGDGGVS